MKNSWTIFGLLLLIIASLSVLLYLLSKGNAMTMNMWIVAGLLIIGIIALIAVVLVGRMQKETPVEVRPKAVAAEEKKSEMRPMEQTNAGTSQVMETAKAEPKQVMETTKAESSQMVEKSETEAGKVMEAPAEAIPSQVPKLNEVKDRGSKIIDIEGIGPAYAAKLNAVKIYTTTDLLQAGATPQGRRELAEKTEISDKLILRWVNMADLFRIKGVGEEYSDLLEAAGVDTVVELSKRVPENLHAKMIEVNKTQNLVRRTPTLNDVGRWVQEAKILPRKIEY